MSYLSIDRCREGHLYRILARNGLVGIFRRNNEPKFNAIFLLPRNKFGRDYVFPEYHWDCGEPFGTAKPLEELEKVPDNIINAEEDIQLEYLMLWEKKIHESMPIKRTT